MDRISATYSIFPGIRKTLFTTDSPEFMLSTQTTLTKPTGSMILC